MRVDDFTPEKIKIVQRWYNQRFKYYGDEWLTMHDIFAKLNLVEVMQFEFNAQTNLLPPKEVAYLNGSKLAMLSQVAYINAINRIANSDKDGRYREMLKKRGKLIAIDELNKKSDSMSSSMFQ